MVAESFYIFLFTVSREVGLRSVKWQSALLCALWFIIQNIAVEMVIYR